MNFSSSLTTGFSLMLLPHGLPFPLKLLSQLGLLPHGHLAPHSLLCQLGLPSPLKLRSLVGLLLPGPHGHLTPLQAVPPVLLHLQVAQVQVLLPLVLINVGYCGFCIIVD